MKDLNYKEILTNLFGLWGGLYPNVSDYNINMKYFEITFDKEFGELPERCRIAFLLRYRNKETYKQIGSQIGVSPERARQLTVKAERILRGKLRRSTLKDKDDIENLNLSVRTHNALRRNSITKISELKHLLDTKELKDLWWIGEKTLTEVKEELKSK